MRVTALWIMYGMLKKKNALVSILDIYKDYISLRNQNTVILKMKYAIHNFFSACPIGYFGFSCNTKCVYPYYGLKCALNCSCPERICHHIYGCNQRLIGAFLLSEYSLKM